MQATYMTYIIWFEIIVTSNIYFVVDQVKLFSQGGPGNADGHVDDSVLIQ